MAMTRNYNDRLFKTSWVRRRYHLARFHWVGKTFQKYRLDSSRLIEFGCFDGRILSYIPEPDHYVGIDANWEGGLDQARLKHARDTTKQWIQADTPTVFDQFENNSFSVAAALETLEHVPPEDLEDYLDAIARVVKGDFLVSVPNEKGLVFLAKHITKKAIGSHSEPYTATEILNATLCRLDQVERREHKGFDYVKLIEQLSKRFSIVKVTGLPFPWLPPALNLTVAIHARSIDV